MKWSHFESGHPYAIALHNFIDDKPFRLPLCVGDVVYIEQHSGLWYYGYLAFAASSAALARSSVGPALQPLAPSVSNLQRKASRVDPSMLQARKQSGQQPRKLQLHLPSENPIGDRERRRLRGIFPQSFVLQLADRPDGALYPHPFLIELTATIRDIGDRLKILFTKNNQKFVALKPQLFKLLELRHNMLSPQITNDEFNEKVRETSRVIDQCNALLGLDLVIRDEQMNWLNPTECGGVELLRKHQEASEEVAKAKERDSREAGARHADALSPSGSAAGVNVGVGVGPTPAHFADAGFGLLVEIKSFTRADSGGKGSTASPAEPHFVLVSLYDKETQRHFSETAIIQWTQQLDNDLRSKQEKDKTTLRMLFTDLGKKDISRTVWLVFQEYSVTCNEVDENKKRAVSTSRRGPIELSDLHSPAANVWKKPVGLAACEISKFLKHVANSPTGEYLFASYIHVACNSTECFDQVLAKIFTKKIDTSKGEGFTFQVTKYDSSHYQNVLSQDTAHVHSMQFSDESSPDEDRNDLYVSLLDGSFTKAGKTSDRNVEAVACLCDESGRPVSPSLIHAEVTAALHALSSPASPALLCFKSIVYYHNGTPVWKESLRIALPIERAEEAQDTLYDTADMPTVTEARLEQVVEYHVRFVFRHRVTDAAKDNERPFALAYFRLQPSAASASSERAPAASALSTMVKDGQHELFIYKIDQKKLSEFQSDDELAAFYLKLPSARDDTDSLGLSTMTLKGIDQSKFSQGPLSMNPKDKDYFRIYTQLCSTRLTHNAELHSLLTWQQVIKQEGKGKLQSALSSLARSVRMKGQRTIQAGREEIIRFLPQVLDALFALLADCFVTASSSSEAPSHGTGDSANSSLFFPTMNSKLEFSRGKDLLDSFTTVVLSTLVTLLTEATDNRVQSRGTQLLDEYFQEGQSRQPYGSQEMLDASSGGQRAIFFCAPFVFVPVAQYVDNALLGRLTPPPGLETPVVFDVLRSLKYLFRIIVRSYQEYERLSGGSKEDFNSLLYSLLADFQKMMESNQPTSVGTQGLALKYLPLAIPDLCQVLEPSYFCANLLAIAEQPPKDTLRDKGVFSLPVLSSRFTFFSDLINSALFKIPECRKELLLRMSAFSCAFLVEQVQFTLDRVGERTEGGKMRRETKAPQPVPQPAPQSPQPAPQPASQPASRFDSMSVKLMLAISRRLFELDRLDLGSVDAEIGWLCAPLQFDIAGDAAPAYLRIGVNSGSSKVPQMLGMYDLLRALVHSVALRKFLPFNAAVLDSSQDLSTAFMSLLGQMSSLHWTTYLKDRRYSDSIDLYDFLSDLFTLFSDLCESQPFRSDWSEMTLYQAFVMKRVIEFVAPIFLERFSSSSIDMKYPFEREFFYRIWLSFLQFCLLYISQDCLQIEQFPLHKQAKIMDRYGDMRIGVAQLFSKQVNSLSKVDHHKLMRWLLHVFLKTTLVPNEFIRRTLLPILFSMLTISITVEPNENLEAGETLWMRFRKLFLSHMDALIVDKGLGDRDYCELYREELISLVESEPDSQVRDEDLFKEYNLKELYFAYVKKLVGMHTVLNNNGEKGYTLLLLDTYLAFTDEPLVELRGHGPSASQLLPLELVALHNTLVELLELEFTPKPTNVFGVSTDVYLPLQSQRNLKQQLLKNALKCFNQGELWEKAIEVIRPLMKDSEEETFDYSTLADLLSKQSVYFKKIMETKRNEKMYLYYVVTFRGPGFPLFMRNKQFIYRGSAFENLAELSPQIESQFPDAIVHKEPISDSENLSGQHIHIEAINETVIELDPKFKEKKLHKSILHYYRYNEVRRFVLKKRAGKVKNEQDVTQLWFDKITFTTRDKAPNFSKWILIKEFFQSQVNPVQHQIDVVRSQMQGLTQSMASFRLAYEEAHGPGSSSDLSALGDLATERAKRPIDAGLMWTFLRLVQGIADAPVNGGMHLFAQFYTDNYSQRFAEQKPDLKTLSSLIVEILELVYDSILLLRNACPFSSEPKKTKDFLDQLIIEKYIDLLQNIEKDCGMTIPDKQQKIKELKLKWAQAVSQESLLSIQTDGPKRQIFSGIKTLAVPKSKEMRGDTSARSIPSTAANMALSEQPDETAKQNLMRFQQLSSMVTPDGCLGSSVAPPETRQSSVPTRPTSSTNAELPAVPAGRPAAPVPTPKPLSPLVVPPSQPVLLPPPSVASPPPPVAPPPPPPPNYRRPPPPLPAQAAAASAHSLLQEDFPSGEPPAKPPPPPTSSLSLPPQLRAAVLGDEPPSTRPPPPPTSKPPPIADKPVVMRSAVKRY